ncbi:site-specific integrase [Pseudonocardia parietis]|uniref:Integrase n=1 Tax=Pseudonocardia parietis TaxID=570936 RepID=A0ABS4W3D3_9PSEU|nr:tyrosine-type recombinase/integrase [Pseudonocardia parietis]MBP2370697.1 integrase [Pseudonocardia parietis]
MADRRVRRITVGDRTRYRFVVDVGRDPATGKRKQITRTFDRQGDADKDLTRILAEVNRGTYAHRSKLTVDEYLGEWLRSASRGKEAATIRNYADALRPARERLGAVELQKLTTRHVEDLVDWMSTEGRRRGGKPGTGLGPRSVQLTLSRLRSALDAAVMHRMLDFNVAAPVKPPAATKVKRVPWSAAEVRHFLGSLDGKRLHAVLLLSLLGLRPAEVCGLRWSDVDLDAGTLDVANTRTLVAGDRGQVVVEKGPKSSAGERSLPLPASVTAALRRLKTLQTEERLAAGGEAYTMTGYVLVDELGAPQRTDWLRRRAYEAMAEAGVRKVRLYDARHACLTYLATNGVPDVIVSAWAGHSDLSLAKRVYVHPSAKDLEQGRDKLTELLG